MTTYNTLTIKIHSVSPNLVKYFMFADVLNGITKPHTYFYNSQTSEQVDYIKLRLGETYVVICEKMEDTWVWKTAHNVERCIK